MNTQIQSQRLTLYPLAAWYGHKTRRLRFHSLNRQFDSSFGPHHWVSGLNSCTTAHAIGPTAPEIMLLL